MKAVLIIPIESLRGRVRRHVKRHVSGLWRSMEGRKRGTKVPRTGRRKRRITDEGKDIYRGIPRGTEHILLTL